MTLVGNDRLDFLLTDVEHLLHRLRAANGSRELLRNKVADRFKLRNVNVLDAGVRNRLHGRMLRVRMLNRLQRKRSIVFRRLSIRREGVGRLA
jgi:hypothetical protein